MLLRNAVLLHISRLYKKRKKNIFLNKKRYFKAFDTDENFESIAN